MDHVGMSVVAMHSFRNSNGFNRDLVAHADFTKTERAWFPPPFLFLARQPENFAAVALKAVMPREAGQCVGTVSPFKGRILTQHTGLPPRDNGAGKPGGKPFLRKPR